jgi:hypothetical protein
VYENSLPRRIFRPKWNEVTGGWRKLHNEDLHDLYYSPFIIRIIKYSRMIWVGHVARKEREDVFMWVIAGKPGIIKPKTRHGLMNNIKMDVGGIGRGDVDWMGLVQNRDKWRALVNAVMNLRVPLKFWESFEWLHNWWDLE